ncbi:hypothetical protein M2282_002267 [Variovorax boronicumulans]|nr:hypothetical protein [Variovorax boronicumulans]
MPAVMFFERVSISLSSQDIFDGEEVIYEK